MYGNKKCMKCGKAATHKFTRVENGKVYDLYYCEGHATESSPYMPKSEIPLAEILEGLLKENVKQGGGLVTPPGLSCRHCGVKFDEYRKTLMLGCSHCYDSFHDYLIPYLRKFHGDIRHVGRKPGGGMEEPDHGSGRGEIDIHPAELEAEAAQPVPPPVKPTLANPQLEIAKLGKRMRRAINNEDFVEAARCRDQIRRIEARMQQQPKKTLP